MVSMQGGIGHRRTFCMCGELATMRMRDRQPASSAAPRFSLSRCTSSMSTSPICRSTIYRALRVLHLRFGAQIYCIAARLEKVELKISIEGVIYNSDKAAAHGRQVFVVYRRVYNM